MIHGRAKPVLHGPNSTEITSFIMEKSHTRLDECLNMLLSCFRQEMSKHDTSGLHLWPPLLTSKKMQCHVLVTDTLPDIYCNCAHVADHQPIPLTSSTSEQQLNERGGEAGELFSQIVYLFSFVNRDDSVAANVDVGASCVYILPSYYKGFNIGKGEILPCVGCDQLPFRVTI